MKNIETSVGRYIVANNNDSVLRSGCEYYKRAVIASVDPFVAVSEDADMVWYHLRQGNYTITGHAPFRVRFRVYRRLLRDWWSSRPRFVG